MASALTIGGGSSRREVPSGPLVVRHGKQSLGGRGRHLLAVSCLLLVPQTALKKGWGSELQTTPSSIHHKPQGRIAPNHNPDWSAQGSPMGFQRTRTTSQCPGSFLAVQTCRLDMEGRKSWGLLSLGTPLSSADVLRRPVLQASSCLRLPSPIGSISSGNPVPALPAHRLTVCSKDSPG